jgi:hypothetical protein
MYIYSVFFTLMRNRMTHGCLKLSKYFLVIFLVFSQLVGCGCKKDAPAGGKPSSSRTNTSGRGSSSSGGNPPVANSNPNSPAANPNSNPPAANSNSNPPAANPNSNPPAVNPNPNPPATNPGGSGLGVGGQTITKQRIQELLEDVIKKAPSPIPGYTDYSTAGVTSRYIRTFLEELRDNLVIPEWYSKLYLYYTIQYKNDEIVALAIDNLKGDINKAYQDKTFLEWATDCNYDYVRQSLIQKGAN